MQQCGEEKALLSLSGDERLIWNETCDVLAKLIYVKSLEKKEKGKEKETEGEESRGGSLVTLASFPGRYYYEGSVAEDWRWASALRHLGTRSGAEGSCGELR